MNKKDGWGWERETVVQWASLSAETAISENCKREVAGIWAILPCHVLLTRDMIDQSDVQNFFNLSAATKCSSSR